MPSVSVVIPTLNEVANIDPLLERIFRVRDSHGLDLEVVFVDDASTDGTCEKIARWQEAYPVVLVSRLRDDGLAGAVIAGGRAALGRYVVVMDADLSHPPETIPDLLAPLMDGSHDMVIGSRYAAGGTTPDWPLQRKLASKLATIPARFFTDAKDPMAGFFAVPRHRLTDLTRQVCGFKIGLEILATAEIDLRVAEVPIVFHDRYQGMSKMDSKVIGAYLQQLLLFVGARLLPPAGAGIPVLLTVLLGCLVDYSLLRFLVGAGHPAGTAHIFSFLAGSAAVFASGAALLRLKNFSEMRLTGGRVAGFWLVCLLVLFLRGGLLAGLTQLAGWDWPPAIVAAVVFAGVAAYLGKSLFIFTAAEARINIELRWRYLGLAVIVYLFVLRLLYAGLPELLEEEAYYWNYARHMDIGFLDHPPMVAALIWLGTAVFGDSEFGVRIGAPVCWLIAAWFVYRLTAATFNRGVAFRSILLFSILPFFVGAGLVMTPDAPLTACWAACLYFLHRALVGNRPLAWLGVGLALGAGLLSKYTIVLLGPATLAFMLLDRRARSWFFRPQPYLAALLALVLFLPVIVWNAGHDWASFVFQSQGRIEDVFMFSSHRLLGGILLLITPAGVLALVSLLRVGRRHFAAAGSEGSTGEGAAYLFTLCMVLVPLSVFFAFSLAKEVKLNWTGPLWLALLPYMALTMRELGARMPADGFVRRLQWLWPATAVTLMLLYAAGLHYIALGLPGVPPVKGPFLHGWPELGRQVEEVVTRVEQKTGQRPLVVGMDFYQLASSLAFYRSRIGDAAAETARDRAVAETLSWHVFGWRGLMYAYWFAPADLAGRDLLLVASSQEKLRNEYFKRYVDKTHNIRRIDIEKRGAPLAVYYYRLVRGYRPVPSEF